MASTDLLLTGAGEFSFGFAVQSDAVTPADTGDTWVWLDAIAPSITWQEEESSDPKSSGQWGAMAPKSVGRKVGTLTFRTELPGQPVAFDASAGNPTAVGPWKLLFSGLGATAVGAYAAAGVDAGGDGNTLVVTAGTLKLGCAYAYGPSATEIRGIGFVRSVSTVTATLAFDALAAPVSGDNLYPLLTAYPSAAGGTEYLTWRLTGDHANADFRWPSGAINECKLQIDGAGRLFGDFSFTVYGGELEEASGGLQTISGPWQQIDEYSASGNAHLVIAQTVRTALDDGTAGDNVCGTKNHVITFSWPHRPVQCPGGTEGVGPVRLRSPEIKVEFDADYTPDWDEDGQNLFRKRRKSKGTVPYALTVGTYSGGLFALHLPAALVAAATPKIVDGAWAIGVTLVAGANTGDGAATDAGKKPARVAVG